MRLKQLKKNIDKNYSYGNRSYQTLKNFQNQEILEKNKNFIILSGTQNKHNIYQGIQKIKQRRQKAMLSPVQNFPEFCKQEQERPQLDSSVEKSSTQISQIQQHQTLENQSQQNSQKSLKSIQSSLSKQTNKLSQHSQHTIINSQQSQQSNQNKNFVQKLIQGQNSSQSNFSNNTRFKTANEQSYQDESVKSVNNDEKSPQNVLFEQTFESSPEEKVKKINSNYFCFNSAYTYKNQKQINQERKLSYQVKQQKQDREQGDEEFYTYYSKSNARSNVQKYQNRYKYYQKKQKSNTKKTEKQKKSNRKSRKQKNKELSVKKSQQLNSMKKWSDSEDENNTKNTKEKCVKPKNSQKNLDFQNQMNQCFQKRIKNLKFNIQKLEKPRKIIIQRLNQIVHELFQPKHVYLQEYGSYSTGLLTEYSDIDLSLQGCHQLDHNQCKRLLFNFSKKLQKFSFILKCTPILTANIPLIKLEADPSIMFEKGEKNETSVIIHIDITVDIVEDMNITSSAFRTTDFIRYCIDAYQSFFDIILFCKHWLHNKGFFDSYKGGINSFGFSMLYVAMLMQSRQVHKKTSFQMLINLLQFCVETFDPKTQVHFFKNNNLGNHIQQYQIHQV